MECVVLAEDTALGLHTMLTVENLGAEWRCQAFSHAAPAWEALQQGVLFLLTDHSEESVQLLSSLQTRPVLSPPWVLDVGQADTLPDFLRLYHLDIPPLAQRQAQRIQPLAQGLMHALDVPSGLGAQVFLPRMLALCTVHPPLLTDLKGWLYPLCGKECGLSAAAVERRLRLCVEACWTRSDLRSLERFFGHSVDPEKGKPTNREFLCRLRENLAFAGKRICR